MKHTIMVLKGLSHGRLGMTAVVLASASGCGGVSDVEMFGHTNAALVEHMGEACELGPVGANESVVDDENAACQPGYCVGQGGQSWTREDQGICTCRCGGPAGTGPLCDCAWGFECRELIKDLGLGGAHLVGSYCVPKD